MYFSILILGGRSKTGIGKGMKWTKSDEGKDPVSGREGNK